MLENLKSMIQYDVKNIEIERNKNKNNQLQKELSDQQKQFDENEYKGKNKFKILLINSFKYKVEEAINTLITIFIFLICILLSSSLIYALDPELINYTFNIFSLIFVMISSFVSIGFLIYSYKHKKKAYNDIEDIKVKIEKNNKNFEVHSSGIENLFETTSQQYKNYIGVVATKEIVEEALNSLNEDNIKEVLRISNDNIEYGALIKIIKNQKERDSKTDIYNKIKNS